VDVDGLPTGVAVTLVAAGTDHTCALTADDRLFCWGDNANGQVGSGGSSVAVPQQIALPGVTALALGARHTCAVAAGGLYCWGASDRGKLGGATAWIGEDGLRRWAEMIGFIEETYPGVFVPEWLFGGKHGWSLRFKKSKSFCTLVPEKDRAMMLIVFGAKEREGAEGILSELSPVVREAYLAATTYHDGKWLFLPLDADEVVSDMKRLLAIKRRPKKH
jgi:hypothetical protein